MMTAISFTSAGYTLAGNLFKAGSNADKAFLFIQGWMGHQNISAAKNLQSLGFTTMTYDMRGNGESEGDISTFSPQDFIADACVAYDNLKAEVGNNVKIVLVGSSFGGYTAAILSTLRNVHALSLRVPASYPDEGYTFPQQQQAYSKELARWRLIPLSELANNKAFDALKTFTGSVQIIEAEKDEMVPHQAVQNYVDACSNNPLLTFKVMKGAPHSLLTPAHRTEYETLLKQWAINL